LPFMLRRKDWKIAVLFLLSAVMLAWLVGGIGLMEPREAVIVYPLVVIAFVSLFNLVSEGRLSKLFLFLMPFIIGFLLYLLFSLTIPLAGLPILLAPGFTITRSAASVQIIFSLLVALLIGFLALVAINRKLSFMVKNLRIGKLIFRPNFLVIVACISLIVAQGFLANQALMEGGTWSNNPLKEVGLSQAADYMNGLPRNGGNLMTTLMASAPLSYLTSRVTLWPAPSLDDFYQSFQKQEFDYLVLAAKSPIIWYPRPEYFEEFLYSSPEGMHAIYNVSSLQFYNLSFSSDNWRQYFNNTEAVLQQDGLHVGGNQSIDDDSGLISNKVFYPFQLNVTCTVSSLAVGSQLPGIFWDDGNNSVGLVYQDNSWIISAFVNGSSTFYYKPGYVQPNSTYIISIFVSSTVVHAFVNGDLIGTLSFYHLPGIGQILVKSTNGEEGVLADVTVSQPFTSLIIYERDGT
jgi:hypothetical protein